MQGRGKAMIFPGPREKENPRKRKIPGKAKSQEKQNHKHGCFIFQNKGCDSVSGGSCG
jgi:hypothetical protein